MKYVVKYTESERGWGGEVWYTPYPTEKLAKADVKKCNKDLPEDTPDYYIIAEYVGEMEEKDIPKGFKF